MSVRAANRVKHISVSQAASGDLIAAPGPGVKIRVTSYVLVAAGAVTAQFNSGAGPTARSGAMSLITGTPLAVQGSNETPVLECGAGEKLTLTLGGAVQVSGHLSYMLVAAAS
jgi:hypothetical protein